MRGLPRERFAATACSDAGKHDSLSTIKPLSGWILNWSITDMRAFEVSVNDKRLCVAGIGNDGVLNTMVDYVNGSGRNELFLRVGGLIGPTNEHVVWVRRRLKRGDEVRVRIVEATIAEPPKERQRRDPKQDLRAQKRYVREMARKLAWELKTKQTFNAKPREGGSGRPAR